MFAKELQRDQASRSQIFLEAPGRVRTLPHLSKQLCIVLQAATQRKTKEPMGIEEGDGTWSRQEDRTFEDALSKIEDSKSMSDDIFSSDCFCKAVSDRWDQIAAMLPGKTSEDVKLR